MIKKFYSLNGNDQLELEFERVDFVNTDDIISLIKDLAFDKVLVAQRDKSVFFIPAKEGDEIDNRDRFEIAGRTYVLNKSLNKVSKRDIDTKSMVALFNNGFNLIYKGEKFKENFILTDEVWGMYSPIDFEKKFVKLKKNIYFSSLWGETIFAPRGSFLCVENIKMREFFVVSNTYFSIAYSVHGEFGEIDNLKEIK